MTKLTKKEKIILELNRYEGCFQSGTNEDGTIDKYYTGIHEQFTEIKHLLQNKGYSVPVVKKKDALEVWRNYQNWKKGKNI